VEPGDGRALAAFDRGHHRGLSRRARDGLAVNLAGGTHHAFRDRGEGYCVFNDAAVAARVMQSEGRAAGS
jgi:acetoin utilization deacetylase AcuC-like enzyme